MGVLDGNIVITELYHSACLFSNVTLISVRLQGSCVLLLIILLAVWSDNGPSMSSKPTNVLFCPQSKDVQFTVIDESRNQRTSISKTMEPANFDLFFTNFSYADQSINQSILYILLYIYLYIYLQVYFSKRHPGQTKH